ncbi:THUMP domain-containing class I SAM-dependent RNA methyltransferase [Cupriavidus oxalaticus]|jgi:putative N6-adenine-specific DNA methylase|uniref:Class I SAM-dependent RNA methyltransferase n=1 Tax=Cupriavidus oxalaticus TaxID=96344 RepID=A0A375GAL2_9BURK|nr:class I SAM-dependent RNA methyltransferase [Cupriavidus oxalaticus]QEZ47752.1 class I SAM-dependent RNA methyltransferase [Cupriavidus oxalaticus]QRQ87927.1 class I SAM-dependent RNA methyltransferase [Cupriavidus oxalaticus]QRQ93746.1 class I SAM-dependent RNA methyltransferase [Cupriavidus oxalaticus]WQD82374.1 class I SAM-dependent RNA methyltransferase [Cupriavidus oxalaticus]SPC14829.1 Ribosomal RNA large subunit methyltransferase L [Cupriavidus oxalaticus]
MTQAFFAPCPRGLESALAEELREIAARPGMAALAPFTVHQEVPGGVNFSGEMAAAYAVNLHSRIASRVLLRVAARGYRHEDDIYNLARGVRWEQWFSPDESLRVDITAHKSPLRSLNFIALRVKDGVCDAMRERLGARPSVDTVSPDVRVYAHLTERDCTLYLDTTGEPLFKRGWRTEKGEAPLKENLAAGILRLAGWVPGQTFRPFYDPMCGSGTFLIEAAQVALGIAPGGSRSFAFEWLKGVDRKAWQKLKDDAQRARMLASADELQVVGSDISTDMLAITQANWQRAGLPGEARTKQVDARFVQPPYGEPGLLLMNPPYGERIAVRGQRRMPGEEMPRDEVEEAAANQFANAFATTLKQNFAGWQAWVFTGDLGFPRRLRLKESRRTPLYNGNIECRLFRFDMVRGTNRAPQAD